MPPFSWLWRRSGCGRVLRHEFGALWSLGGEAWEECWLLCWGCIVVILIDSEETDQEKGCHCRDSTLGTGEASCNKLTRQESVHNIYGT